MQWLSRGRWIAAVLFLAAAALPYELPAQGGGPEKVRFVTFDGVTLRGTFHAGKKAGKSPCVILLHAIGGTSAQEGWDALAKKLHEKGFAVLAFDFRGHGDSKEVDPNVFWRLEQNARLKGFNAAKPRSEVSYKDFTSFYHYLMLVNDIAAARHYLDKRNDNQECNSANVTVIGAESGAALGAFWVVTEWQRSIGPPSLPGGAAKGAKGGQEINCAVWLSITDTLGGFKAPVEAWVRYQPVRDKIPMFFAYGADDTKGERYTQHLYLNTLKAKTDKKLSKLTLSKGIKGTKLSGRDLLTKGLETQDFIVEYVEKVIADNGTNAYERRDANKAALTRVPIEVFLNLK